MALRRKIETGKAFQHLSSFKLVASTIFFQLCGSKMLVTNTSRVLASNSVVSQLFQIVVKHTVFKMFCGGENLQSALIIAKDLKTSANINTIFDYSTEEKTNENAWNENLALKLKLLQDIDSCMTNESFSFIPLKPTALICPIVLEAIAAVLENETDDISDTEAVSRLPASLQNQLFSGLARMRQLCVEARLRRVSLLLDAEQSNRQPAIDLVSRLLSAEFNGIGCRPIVFNTYQSYLRRMPKALSRDLSAAAQGQYSLGVKLVRGAYMKAERKRAVDGGTVDPIVPSKEAADVAYNQAITRLLQEHMQPGPVVVAAAEGGNIHLVLASHNLGSMELAAAEMQRLGIPRDDERIHFAQILGMSNHSTVALGLCGFNVCKLVPFGPFHELLPWLLRRFDENQDMIGAMQVDKHFYIREITQRLKFNRKRFL